jgi:DNA-binding IclR family transcriptional regulator
MPHSFTSWLARRRRQGQPEADRLLSLIAAAGPVGMSRKQLGDAISLERDGLDQLLDGLVQSGILAVADEGGIRVFRVGAGAAVRRL